MKTLTKFINPFPTNLEYADKYEVIENELLTNSDFKGLTVSGSLFSLTTFKRVTFESCVFFASRMENCIFIDCNFIDCSFQFTTTEHCDFKSSKFKNCQWEASPVRKGRFSACTLDPKTAYYLGKESNQLEGCLAHEGPTWEQLDQDFARVA